MTLLELAALAITVAIVIVVAAILDGKAREDAYRRDHER